MNAPRVSVVIPAYQAEAFLGEAIASVLQQTTPVHEVVVVDDGSTDGTASVAASFGHPVRLVRQPNGGVSVARSRGAEESCGDFVAFLDADDVWEPEKLTLQLPTLQEGRAVAAFTGAASVGPDGGAHAIEAPRPERIDLEDLVVHRTGSIPAQIPSSLLLAVETYRRVGPWDASLSDAADWDYAIRLRRLGPFVGPPEPLVRYRRHAGAMSGHAGLRAADACRLFDKLESDAELVRLLGRPLLRRARARNVVVSAAGLAAGGRPSAAARLILAEGVRRPYETGGALVRRWRQGGAA